MPNVTIALDDQTLRQGREYAQTHNMSLNDLIRSSLRRTIAADRKSDLSRLWALMDRAIASAPKDLKPWKFNRDEIYEDI